MSKLGLSQAIDREIWDYAKEHRFTICTKDSDFRQLSFFHGAPPKTIWLRIGNRNTDQIAAVLTAHFDDLAAFGGADESLLIIDAGQSDGK